VTVPSLMRIQSSRRMALSAGCQDILPGCGNAAYGRIAYAPRTNDAQRDHLRTGGASQGHYPYALPCSLDNSPNGRHWPTEMERRIIEKCLKDASFRQTLLADHGAVLEVELGTRPQRRHASSWGSLLL
jgi:hypothetical protein